MGENRWEADMNLIHNGGSLIAVGNVTLDRVFVIRQVKVVQGANGMFISLPRQRVIREGKTEWHSILNLISESAKKDMEEAVMVSMKKELAKDLAPMPKLQVKITQVQKEGTLKAFATVQYGELLSVQGIRVIESDGKRWVAMPQQKNAESYQDLLFFSTSLSRQKFDEQVLNAYEQQVEKQLQEQHSPGSDREEEQTGVLKKKEPARQVNRKRC